MTEHICKVTGTEFELSGEEQRWYGRFTLPAPDLLREERIRRKLAFLNTHSFQWRTAEGIGVSSIGASSPHRIYSAFSPAAPFPVLALADWNSLDFRDRHFDFISRKPFFEQLHEAWKSFPRPDRFLIDSDDAISCHLGYALTRCYLVSSSDRSEQSLYSVGLSQCVSCVDCLFVSRSTNCYECVDCRECRGLLWGSHCERVSDSSFMLNCSNCQDCLCCEGLDGAQYCILNKQLSQEEFARASETYRFDTRSGLDDLKNRFAEFLQSRKMPHWYGSFTSDGHLSGNGLWGSSNISLSFFVDRSTALLGALDCVDAQEVLDVTGGRDLEHCAQCVSVGGGARNLTNALYCWKNVEDVHYSAYCTDSRHLFGCFGLHGREYCIGNQQYSKGEYQTVFAQIREWLVGKRVYGKFFPSGFSDYPYNHTAAQDFFPLNKFQAEMLGFRWEENEVVRPSQLLHGAEERMSELPSQVSDIDRSQLAHRFYLCEWSAQPYQLTVAEVEFYDKFRIAPPAKCFDERHRERVSQLGGLKLSPLVKTEQGSNRLDEALLTPFTSSSRRPVLARSDWIAERKANFVSGPRSK